MLLLPGHLEFAETLANLPFFYKEMASRTCDNLHLFKAILIIYQKSQTTKDYKNICKAEKSMQFVEYIDGYANTDEPTEENDDCLNSWELSDEWLGSI
jgi:hypothetical protein